jgi:hypothetical protein
MRKTVVLKKPQFGENRRRATSQEACELQSAKCLVPRLPGLPIAAQGAPKNGEPSMNGFQTNRRVRYALAIADEHWRPSTPRVNTELDLSTAGILNTFKHVVGLFSPAFASIGSSANGCVG